MLGDVTAKLSEIEGKLRTLVARIEGDVAAVETTIRDLDAGLGGALDRVSALGASMEGTVAGTVAKLRDRVMGLAPPP